jgi:hypothetical protein
MATNGRPYHEEAWRKAKKICRLNARQVEMACALGMNPRKLPSLRPSPQQRWKLPVGEFIEECYRKRFGGGPLDPDPHKPKPGPPKPLTRQRDVDALKGVTDAAWQVEDLVCYLMNLADDLDEWLAQGTVAPEVLPQVIRDLREIVEALETGAPVSPFPAIPQPPRQARYPLSQRGDRKLQSDDEIPF